MCEGLGALIKRAYQLKFIRNFSIVRGAPTITHLFFADDSIIFTYAKMQEVFTIRDNLRRYEEMSEQKVNLVKSKYFLVVNLSIEFGITLRIPWALWR